MVSGKYLLFVPLTESDSESEGKKASNAFWDAIGVTQMTGLFEAWLNSCDTPSNRGASASDRTTWAAAVDTSSACVSSRDATTEEILHLITTAAS